MSLANPQSIGWVAVLMLSDGTVYYRSRITTEHQARMTAAQWANEWVAVGIQEIFAFTPEVIK